MNEENSQKQIIVGFAGNIGAGKSKLSKLTAAFLDFELIPEVVNEDILNEYYAAIQRGTYNIISYKTQLYFVQTRGAQLVAIRASDRSAVLDRLMDEDIYVFSKNLVARELMKQEEYQHIINTRDANIEIAGYPDLTIYLRTSIPKLRERIEKRIRLEPRRENERALLDPHNSYLEDLNILYEQWFEQYEGPKVALETDDLILADRLGRSPFSHGHILPTLQRIEDMVMNGNYNNDS